MILQCKDCDSVFTGHVSKLDVLQMYGIKWNVTQKHVRCARCGFERKANQQYDRNRKKTIGTVRGDAATLLQKSVRLRFAASTLVHTFVVDGAIKKGRTDLGLCRCVTCGDVKHYKKMDGGHYHRRNKLATLLDANNVHPQCVKCNEYADGNYDNYRIFMEAHYSKRQLRELKDRLKDDPPSRAVCATQQVIFRYDIKVAEDYLRSHGVL